MRSKRKLLKKMLFHTEHLSMLSIEVAANTQNPPGLCNLAFNICVKTEKYPNTSTNNIIGVIKKYKKHTTEPHLFWFTRYDWKTRHSFLKEVCRIELNPFNKLLYKLGLTKFRFIIFNPSQEIW